MSKEIKEFIKWGQKIMKQNPPKFLSFYEAIEKAKEIKKKYETHLQQDPNRGNNGLFKRGKRNWKV